MIARALPDIAEGIAARLLLRLLPDPRTAEIEPRLSALEADEAVALAGVLSSLKTDHESLSGSPAIQRQVRDALAAVLRRGPLSDARRDAATQRLGTAGSLPLSDYKISIPPGLFKTFQEFGERQNYVESAIREADACEHISIRAAEQEEQVAHSLFVRRVTSKSGEYAHLVITQRVGKRLDFNAIWRVYPEVVRWDRSPRDILRAFVQQFGLMIDIPTRAPTQFIESDAVPQPAYSTARLNVVNAPLGHEYMVFGTSRMSAALPVLSLSFVYAVDLTVYGEFLATKRR